jgi:glucose/arabinose dehydrogenase
MFFHRRAVVCVRRACEAPAAVALLAVSLAGLAPASAASLPPGFAETSVAYGFSNPTSMALAPDGRIFVCEQGGRLRVIKNGTLLGTPFLTVVVNSTGERGLLGVAFDPAFASNGYVYVYYTATTPTIHNRVSRFTANGDQAVAGSETVLLNLDALSSATNHNGGALHFGNDGKLYIAVGDNANGSNAQTLSNLLGKILRINKDGTIPTDNPFYGTAAGVNRAIWALGLRNPFTFAFHRTTGRMFINDVGQDTWEEIDDGIKGSNYGWPLTEGHTSDPRFRDPLYVYAHGSTATTGCAITGGAFYDAPTGQFPPAYANTYFFADYCSGWIRRYDPANGTVTGFATGASAPVDLRVGADGSLYYLARGGKAVFRVRYTASQAPTISTQPSSLTVPVGRPASFSVTASGTAPLAYQWQRDLANIPGATGQTYTLASPALADSGARFRVVVRNAYGSATSNEAILTVTDNSAPVATIIAPANRTLYDAGDTIQYSGTGTDAEDGTLPASAFTWEIVFHHETHTHPFIGPVSGAKSGSFVIPTLGETSADVWYRIHLTVRDSGGLTDTTFVDVVPRTSALTLATSPAGLQVTLDAQPTATPISVSSVVGMSRTLGVVSPQTAGGVTYDFVSWSDGGAATHAISTPATDTTYTATYRARPASPGIGLVGTYYDNADFTGAAMTRIDPTVSFNWGTGAPPGMGADTFSVRWTGQVQARATGTHTFYVSSDDGVRLWVAGKLVVDNWTDHFETEASGTIDLTAGQRYDVRLDYYEDVGAAEVKLSWSAPGVAKQIVPTSALHPYALLVVPSTTLDSADAAVEARLQRAGYAPVIRTAAASRAADATGRALVVVSSSVASPDVGAKFRATKTPVLSCEAYVFDDMGMTGPSLSSDYGAAANQRQLVMVTPSHPMAAGLSGTVTVTTAAANFSWGEPAATAVVIARLPGTPATRAGIFGYEKGAAMVGLSAPGRRVGFFLGDKAAASLTSQGWALFDAAVRWASGR